MKRVVRNVNHSGILEDMQQLSPDLIYYDLLEICIKKGENLSCSTKPAAWSNLCIVFVSLTKPDISN